MPVGSAGDVHPFVGAGLELARRGHDVTVATNGHFKDLIERVGLAFVEQGSDAQFREVIADARLWKDDARATRAVFGMSAQLMREQYELCMAGDWSVVMAGPLAFGARIAQDQRDLPLATVQLAPVFLSAEQPPRLPGLVMPAWYPLWLRRAIFRVADGVVDFIAAGPINDFRREVGLPPVKRLVGRWWNSPRCVLAMFPPWFASPAGDWPANLVQTGFPLYDERGASATPEVVRAFMRGGERPIVFTCGSANVHGRAFFAASLRACELLGRRALLVTKFAEQLPGELPAWAMHVDYAPFSELLPGAGVFVQHGGIGTTAQALAAGVPQLVVPLAHDQFENAHRVKMLGAGDVLRGKRYTAARAAAKLRALLGDKALHARCSAVAARVEPGAGIVAAADVIERLAGEKSR